MNFGELVLLVQDPTADPVSKGVTVTALQVARAALTVSGWRLEQPEDGTAKAQIKSFAMAQVSVSLFRFSERHQQLLTPRSAVSPRRLVISPECLSPPPPSQAHPSLTNTS